jgi:cell division protein FtsB
MGSKLITLYENKKAVDEKLENLELQKNNLAGSIESLSTESGIEETLRDKYFVAKEGWSFLGSFWKFLSSILSL